MNATATLIVLFSCAVTLATIWVYERWVQDLKNRVRLAEDHAESCQHLVAAMTRHPSSNYPGLRVIRGEDAS